MDQRSHNMFSHENGLPRLSAVMLDNFPLYHCCKVRHFPSPHYTTHFRSVHTHTPKYKYGKKHIHIALFYLHETEQMIAVSSLPHPSACTLFISLLPKSSLKLHSATDQPSNSVAIDLSRYPPPLSACQYFLASALRFWALRRLM